MSLSARSGSASGPRFRSAWAEKYWYQLMSGTASCSHWLEAATNRPVVQEHIEALKALLHDTGGSGRVDGGALDMHDSGLAVELAEEVARAG